MATVETLRIAGELLVSDLLSALESMVGEAALAPIDKALQNRANERVSFDDIEIKTQAAIDALDEASELPMGEGMAYILDQTDVQRLAEAIRGGNTSEAEQLLDRIFADLPDAAEIREWIDRGRYSKKAREARQPKPLRKAA